MNSIEEILWKYIDGNCSPEEQKIVSTLIAEDESYRLKYLELVVLSNDLSEMELDEPSMAFTYNVMEGIRAEHALVPLKARVNKRIIMGIALFFSITLFTLLLFVLLTIKLPAHILPANSSLNFKIPDINSGKEKMVVQGFIFFDVVLGLYLLDGFLRRKADSGRA
jgi:hypothetical protein